MSTVLDEKIISMLKEPIEKTKNNCFDYLLYNFYRYSKDFNALRCHEKQMLKLADLIKTALNEVGCEELPSGCDDISVDQSFIENNINNTEQPVC